MSWKLAELRWRHDVGLRDRTTGSLNTSKYQAPLHLEKDSAMASNYSDKLLLFNSTRLSFDANPTHTSSLGCDRLREVHEKSITATTPLLPPSPSGAFNRTLADNGHGITSMTPPSDHLEAACNSPSTASRRPSKRLGCRKPQGTCSIGLWSFPLSTNHFKYLLCHLFLGFH